MDLRIDQLKEFQETVKKTFIFLPIEGKDMKEEYPELRNIEEFVFLTQNEMSFVWLLGNATSPLRLQDTFGESERRNAINRALSISKLGEKMSVKDTAEYIDGRYGDKLNRAIQKMTLFKPSVRMRAKLMNETMLNNLEKMIDITEEELESMKVSDKKEYAALCKTVTDDLELIIPQVENAYGVREYKKAVGAKGSKQPTLMDEVMNE